MKKAIVFLVLFALLFTVCGCRNNVVDIRGKYEYDTTNVSSDVSNTEESSTEEFSLGNISGNVYINDFIGVSYRLDENWTFYNEEQIKEINNIAVDMAGDKIEELLKDATVVDVMCAYDDDQLDNVNINLEKVSNDQLLLLNIAENFQVIIPILKEGFENMGYKNINCEITTVDVDGKTFDALRTTAEINGVNVYQTMIQKKCDGYLATITMTTFFDDKISDLIDNLSWTK